MDLIVHSLYRQKCSLGRMCLSNIGGKLNMEEPQRFAEYVSGLRGRPKQTTNMFQASLKTLFSPSLADDLKGQIRVCYKIKKKTRRSDGSARTYKKKARGRHHLNGRRTVL
ncbi:hypothetical protein ACQJBY_048303 [Aegilops geniculata]